MDDLIDAFEVQGGYCEKAGAPTYAFLCAQLAQDIKDSGPSQDLLSPYRGSPKDDAIALRLLGGFHFLALAARAPDLAKHFRTCGGDGTIAPTWPAVQRLFSEEAETLRSYLSHPPQTNEVMRSAALLPGFLTVAQRSGLPLRCLELGASGGLNQVWDRHAYDYGSFTWGGSEARLTLDSKWTGPAPSFPNRVEVVARAGCDVAPIDLSMEEGRTRLRSYIWPDQPDRMARLMTAIEVCLDAGVSIEQADAADWLADALLTPQREVATVVYHSIFWQYLPLATQTRIEAIIRRAMAEAPVYWLTMEIEERLAGTLPRLTLVSADKPEGDVLAEVHFHGGFVRWRG